MPRAPLRPCAMPRCPTLVDRGYCATHKQPEARGQQPRMTSAQRGYGSRWQKARATFLRQHPLCKHCLEEKRVTPATDVDHITPHKGSQALFWNSENWQPLCHSHHSVKTAKEDSGFGNTRTPKL